MKKKKEDLKASDNNNMDPLEDTQIYRAGQEADEIDITDDEDSNGGIPDETADDIDEEDEDDDDF